MSAAKKKRGTETLGDMTRSLGLVMAIVAAVFLVARAPSIDEQKVRPVAYADDIEVARQAANYPIWAPEPVPSGWTATSAYTRGTQGEGGAVVLRIGFVTADNTFAGLAESNGDRDKFVDEVAGKGASPAGVATVAGVDWTVLRQGDELTYLRQVTGATLMVTGTASRADLEALLGSLRSEPVRS